MVTGEWCGTPNGYQVHVRRHEAPCQVCLDVRRDWVRRYRFVSGRQTDPTRCKGCGSVFVDHVCGRP